MRVLLATRGRGHSLRQMAERARKAQLADLSSVALWKRLNKSQEWLRGLCIKLFRELGMERADCGAFQVRAVDGTTGREQGRSGSLQRQHYNVRLSAGRAYSTARSIGYVARKGVG